MKTAKQNILITLHSRLLTEGEADELRAFVVSLKPKLHLVLGNWRWVEVRGVSEQAAQRIVEQVRGLGLRCHVSGLARAQTVKADA